MSETMTHADLQAKIAKHAWEDPAFEAEFMADPKATFEKYAGSKLPAEVRIHAHYNTPSELHFVIPARPAGASGELTDEDLERVAGGEVAALLTLCVTGLVTMAATVGLEVGLQSGW